MKKFVALLAVLTLCFSLTAHNTANASTYNNPKDFVTHSVVDTGKQVVVVVTNITKQTISMTITPHYLDNKGLEILVYSKDIVTFEPGKTAYIVFDNPTGYKSYTIELFVSTDYYRKGTGISDRITTSTMNDYYFNNLLIFGINNSPYNTKEVKLAIVYFRFGNIVKVSEKTLTDFKANNSFIIPEHIDFQYDDYKINVNEAYY